MSLSGHQSARSRSCDWLTPPAWVESLAPFDLDPCASYRQPWRTASHEIFADGGLDAKWYGLVWLNPPYGPPSVIEPWMDKMADHNSGIACIPARTETACWHKYVWPVAESILFVKGRPHFHYPVTGERAKANSGAPIALIAYGQTAHERLKSCGIRGRLVTLNESRADTSRSASQGAAISAPDGAQGE